MSSDREARTLGFRMGHSPVRIVSGQRSAETVDTFYGQEVVPPMATHRQWSGTARWIVRVVAVAGIVPTKIVAALGHSIDGVSQVSYYAAVKQLVAAGVLLQLRTRHLGLLSTRGVRTILLPGPQWTAYADALGVSGADVLDVTRARSVLVEQLMFGGLLLERLARGWRLVDGADWLMEAGNISRPTDSIARGQRLAEVRFKGTFYQANAKCIVGLIPPGPPVTGGDDLPTLLVNARYTPPDALPQVLDLALLVAPFTVVFVEQAQGPMETMRRMLRARLRDVDHCSVHILPRTSGRAWNGFWRSVVQVAETTTAVMADQLAERTKARGVEPGG